MVKLLVVMWHWLVDNEKINLNVDFVFNNIIDKEVRSLYNKWDCLFLFRSFKYKFYFNRKYFPLNDVLYNINLK